MTEDIKKFIDLVKVMRVTQKEYFRTRDKKVLSASKELERQVDHAILKMEYPKLF